MRTWLVCGLPAALLLGSACSGDDSGGEGLNTNGGLNGGNTAQVNGDGGGGINQPTPDGGFVPGLPEPGANPLTPTSTDYHVDATGESGLPQGTIDELKGGGGSCNTDVLYPYEGTVFSGGLLSPVIMWAGNADAAYVHLSYDSLTTLDFEYATGGSSPGEMRIPQEHWDQIVRRSQNSNLKVKMTVKSGGSLSTCDLTWRIAPGNMIGSIYYNTYNAPEANGVGAIMRLRLGNRQAEVYQKTDLGVPPTGPCRSCHSVSADGSTLVSSEHLYGPFGGTSFGTDSYQLQETPQPPLMSVIENATFGALTPHGDKILAMGNPDCTGGADTFPRSANNFPLVEGPDHARLLDTSNGQELSASGLQQDWYMWMPQFSPDGDKIVFNHAKPGGGGTDRRTLAWMTFDHDSNSFGEPQTLVPTADGPLGPAPSLPYSPESGSPGSLVTVLTGNDGCTASAGRGAIDPGVCEGPCYPAWPFFTPDGNGVIFSLIDQPDFSSAIPGRTEPAKSELWYVDLRDGQYVKLANANEGLAPGDELLNYYPTVLPVQVGGYFWVFWTSTRAWGHKDLLEGHLPIGFDDSYVEAPKKRIWASAIRPRGVTDEFGLSPLEDLSHPPFYLEGQSNSGNVRAFAALNPCLESGNSCTSGLDCCSGYCAIEQGAESGTCVDEPPTCADVNERCDTSEDCCQPLDDDDPSNDNEPMRQCIGGYCGFITII